MARRPNILFVFGDQHRAITTGCYGNREIRTPTIDRLAQEGMRATTAISNAPLCGPYRASLMTGMYAFKCGMPTNFQTFRPPVPCLGEVFKRAGYATGYVGKQHLYFPTGNREVDGRPEANSEFVPPEFRCGFDYWRGINEGHDFHDWHYYNQDDPAPVHCTRYQPEMQVDQALDFIREQSGRDKEWCLFVSWTPPHPPFIPPAGYAEKYPSPAFPANVPQGKPLDYARKSGPKYYGLIDSLDEALGRLLQGLAKIGAAEETIVVYTADHGEMLAAHGYMGHKRWPYDESLRVPFVMRWPGRIQAGRLIQKPLSAIDIYPTLLELAGIPLPQAVDGKSAASAILTGDESDREQFAFCQMHYSYVPWPGWRALRSNRYLYARIVDGPWLLFDHQTDPLEQNNVVNDRGYRPLREELDALLLQRMAENGDSWSFRIDTGDWNDYNDPKSDKIMINDMGYTWPGCATGGLAPV
jgi:arylsulfatase A-like enzyme